MAGTDQPGVACSGIGGHGSNPQRLKAPIVLAAAIREYQVIASWGIDPLIAAVNTVGPASAGSNSNVLPPAAISRRQLRWFEGPHYQETAARLRLVVGMPSILAACKLPAPPTYSLLALASPAW